MFSVMATPDQEQKSLSYRNSYSSASTLTTYTFAACDIGTASAGRRVVVGITGASSGRTTVSVTIGGVAATKLVEVQNGSSTTAAIWNAHVPSGTTGDVVVTWSGSQLRCAVHVWDTKGRTSDAAYHTGSNTSDPVASATVNTLSGGYLVACGMTNTAATVVWANATERFDSNVGGANMTSADNASTSAGTLAVSVTFDTSTGGPVLAVASF
jgi:hypothetical protein